MEFATIWNAYGVEVSIVEMLPHVLPLEDEEAAAEVAKAFMKKGIKIYTSHKVESVETYKEKARIIISTSGEKKELMADQALVAIGFKPNSKGIGIENVGVKTSEAGFIEVDDRMATNIAGIWSIGDVTGKLMLAHAGSAMGIVCAETIANLSPKGLNYLMMPRATYCYPQVASFGYTEVRAKELGHAVKVGKFPFQANGKALGLGDYSGWIKLIVDVKYGEILGATLVGTEVTELLPELTLAQMMELTPTEIARNIHAHPTLSEVIMEAAHEIEGSPIHT
jgi:dihydrolipoamide dehydrogenase